MALLCIFLLCLTCTSCRNNPRDVNYIENGIMEAELEQFDNLTTYSQEHLNGIVGENQNGFEKQICWTPVKF